MKRREFLKHLTVIGGSLVFGCRTSGSIGVPEEDAFSFFVLGDIHFDRLKDHDVAYVREHFKGNMRQIEHYCRVTRENSPFLLNAMKARIASTKAPVSHVLQLGDFTQGLCGNEALATQQLGDFVKWAEGFGFGVPFVVTKGNHDIIGPGGRDAYRQTVLPWVSKVLGQPIEKDRYFFRHRNCLFISWWHHTPGALEWLLKTLEQEAPKSEHVFLLSHYPIIPNSARAHWAVYLQGGRTDAMSQKVIEACGKYGVIVLSGHLHKYGVLSRKTQSGGFVQLALCSVMGERANKIRHELTTKDYGQKLIDTEPRFHPASLERRRELLKSERPHIGFFEYAHAMGFGRITVKGSKVLFEVFSGPKLELYRTHDVSKLLDGVR